ncbi:hypothetical protein NOR_07239 [Metarhizium rileyi]|uniref:Hydrophobin n=1 Tax=Metarhizium rileyi (strain RCEF 4871) TaxID=1649241 RepID=A0A166YSY2_METRR|nr:hypothetical protein NOR_07239 [Metarhizium rileyi RCEF 4871]
MLSHLFTVSVFAFSILGSAAALPADESPDTALFKRQCRGMCCDAIVDSVSPGGKIGIGCTPGGVDCGFHGQVNACCIRFTPIGVFSGSAVGCE